MQQGGTDEDVGGGRPIAAAPLAGGTGVTSGLRWGVVAQAGQQLLSLVATLVLARLLSPTDFGIVAVAGSVLALAQLVLNVGFGASIVRRETLDREVVDTLFWLSVLAALPVALAVVAAAGPVAALLGEPGAADYLRVMGLVVVLSLAGGVPMSLLQRQMRFRAFYAVQLIGTVVYVAVEIVLAAGGLGALAVAIGQAAMSAVTTAGYLLVSRHRPALVLRRQLVRGELGFASAWVTTHGLAYVSKNADYWLVGRYLGAEALGAYYISFVLPSLLRQRLNWVVSTVLFPVLARRAGGTHDDLFYVKVVRLQLLVAAPALLLVAVLAQPLVAVLFGDRWQASVQAMPWLALSALVLTLGQTQNTAGLVQQSLRPVVQAQALQAGLLVSMVGTAVVAGGDLRRVGQAVLVSSVLGLVAQQWLLGAAAGTPLRLTARAVAPIILPGGALLLVARAAAGGGDVGDLLLGASAGSVAFLVTLMALHPAVFRDALAEVRRLARPSLAGGAA